MAHAGLLPQLFLCAYYLILIATAKVHFVASQYDRRADPDRVGSLQVDLGYSVYKGYYDGISELNIWQGYVLLGFCRWRSVDIWAEFDMPHLQLARIDGERLSHQERTQA